MAIMNGAGENGHGVQAQRARTVATWAAGLLALGCDAQVDPAYGGEPLLTISGQVEVPLGVGDVEVGLLWMRPASDPVEVTTECSVELSGATPSPCVAACGVPSCDDLNALEAWDVCASQCEGPTGVSNITVITNGSLLFSGAVGQTAPALGAFPAQFRLDVLEPPPAELLTQSSSGERLAVALFVALDPAQGPFELDLEPLPSFPPWLVGGSGTHLLMYTPDGVPRDSTWGTLLELGLEPGYQLLEIVRVEGVSVEGDSEEGTEFGPVPSVEAARVRLTLADPATIDWPLTD